MVRKMLIGLVAGVLTLAVLAILPAIPTYFLWNWLMPTIFGAKAITLLQAWGLVWLCAMLFKVEMKVTSN